MARPGSAGQAGAEGQVRLSDPNGRANAVWQSIYLDQQNEYVMDRWPYPYLQVHPDDMAELGASRLAILVEVWNDAGSTQAMVQPTPTAKRKETFMLFAYSSGVQGNVVNDTLPRRCAQFGRGNR